MDLRWQIHHSEKNWNREKVELLDRLDRDRQEWEQQKKELLWRIEQVKGVPRDQWTGKRVQITKLKSEPLEGEKKKNQANVSWASGGRGKKITEFLALATHTQPLHYTDLFIAKFVGNFFVCVYMCGMSLVRGGGGG